MILLFSPDFICVVADESDFGPLFFFGEGVAFFGGGEAALGAQAELVFGDVLGGFFYACLDVFKFLELREFGGDEAEDDLLFRDVAAQLEPCFTARGYTLKLDGQEQDKGDNLVFISFGISEPDVRIYTTVSYVPYTWGRGHFRHTRWIREEDTRTKVFFHAGLLLEGCTRAPDGGRGKNLWRTEIRCTAQDDDFRTLLQAMLPVLQQHLGKDTSGRRYFVVTLDEDEPPVVEEKEVTAN